MISNSNFTESILSILFLAIILLIAAPSIFAQPTCVNVGSSVLSYAQNFNALGISSAPRFGDPNIFPNYMGNANVFVGTFNNAVADDNTTIVNIPGWAIVEIGTATSSVTGRYGIDNGNNAGGNTYSYGTTGAPERALGALSDDGHLAYLVGCFRNIGATTLSSVQIGYAGETWRRGASGTQIDRFDFQYGKNITNIFNGAGFSDFNALDYQTSPGAVSAPAGALNGNAAANRTVFPLTSIPVTLAPNETLYLRWQGVNITGPDDGLAIDDLNIIFTGPTAAGVSIGGRALNADGRGIAGARITLTEPSGAQRIVHTNPFGYYRFYNLAPGETYIIAAESKRYEFGNSPQILTVNEAIDNFNFTAFP